MRRRAAGNQQAGGRGGAGGHGAEGRHPGRKAFAPEEFKELVEKLKSLRA